jgi:hypothetical protein
MNRLIHNFCGKASGLPVGTAYGMVKRIWREGEWHDNRWRGFGDQAARWRKAEGIRSFLAALEQHPEAIGTLRDATPIAEWLAWARARLAPFDPMTPGPSGGIRERISSKVMMQGSPSAKGPRRRWLLANPPTTLRSLAFFDPGIVQHTN